MTVNPVSVRDLLRLPSLVDRAEVVAGWSGLDRRVKWIHVSELLDIGRLLNGGEFLLTTGMLLARSDREVQRRFVRDLSEHGAVGLGVELVQWMKAMPEPLVRACNDFQLPLVAIREEVRFSTITEEAARLLFYRHRNALRQIDEATSAMMGRVLAGAELEEVLQIGSERLGQPIVAVLGDGRVLTAPQSLVGSRLAERILKAIPAAPGAGQGTPRVIVVESLTDHLLRRVGHDDWKEDAVPPSRYLRLKLMGAPVHVLGRQEGAVWVGVEDESHPEASLLVDRVAMCVGTAVLHQRQRVRLLEPIPDDPLELLLTPNAEESLLRRRLTALGKVLGAWATVSVIRVGPRPRRLGFTEMARPRPKAPKTGDSTEPRRIDPVGCIRWLHEALYEQFLAPHTGRSSAPARLVATSVKVDSIRAIFTGDDYRSLLEHLRSVLQRLGEQAEPRCGPDIVVFVGIGRPRKRLVELYESYQDALAVCEHQAAGRASFANCSFEDLSLTTLLEALPPQQLEEFARRELDPILSLPPQRGRVLLDTLRVLVDTNFNVAAASRRLHMRRQSVYRRLYQLDDLLAIRSGSPNRRAGIVLALRAWEALQSLPSRQVTHPGRGNLSG